MLVLYGVFSNLFRMNQENFALYILVGLITWRFLANGTSAAISSIVGRPSLVTQVYIPRQILVLSTILSCFISSLLEFSILIPLLIIVGVTITPYILFFPIAHVIFFFIVYGLSLMLAALYVYYRDLNQIWQVIIQLFFSVPNRLSALNNSSKVPVFISSEPGNGADGNVPEFFDIWNSASTIEYHLSYHRCSDSDGCRHGNIQTF